MKCRPAPMSQVHHGRELLPQPLSLGYQGGDIGEFQHGEGEYVHERIRSGQADRWAQGSLAQLAPQAPLPGLYPPGSSRFHMKGLYGTGSFRAPLCLACRGSGRPMVPARPVVVRAAPLFACVPRFRLPQLRLAAATGQRWSSQSAPFHGASWRTAPMWWTCLFRLLPLSVHMSTESGREVLHGRSARSERAEVRP